MWRLEAELGKETALTWAAAGFAFASAAAWFWAARVPAFAPTGSEPAIHEAKQLWMVHGLLRGAREGSRRNRVGAIIAGLPALFAGLNLVV